MYKTPTFARSTAPILMSPVALTTTVPLPTLFSLSYSFQMVQINQSRLIVSISSRLEVTTTLCDYKIVEVVAMAIEALLTLDSFHHPHKTASLRRWQQLVTISQ